MSPRYGNTSNVVWDGLRHTIWMIGRVELDSTFPTIKTTSTKKDFNGNAWLGRCATIGDISFFLLNHVSVTENWNFGAHLLRLVRLHVLDLRSPTKYGNICVVPATHQSQTVADCDRRPSPTVIADSRQLWSQTVADRYRSYGNQALILCSQSRTVLFYCACEVILWCDVRREKNCKRVWINNTRVRTNPKKYDTFSREVRPFWESYPIFPLVKWPYNWIVLL